MKVVDVDLSAAGWLKVLCIDTGVTTLTEVDCIRTLDIPGSSEASHLGRTGPLAFKFILADVVVPNGEWSDRTMSFLKVPCSRSSVFCLSLALWLHMFLRLQW